MRLIPVIDLLDGQAVHAVKGERANYKPVKSVLCDTANPLAIARAFRDRLGLHEVYVADLNAIQGLGRTNHRNLIAALASREKMDVILDAGVPDVENAREWIGNGVRKVVIGSETLRAWDDLQDIPARIDQDRLIFSLDSHSGKILSRCPALTALTPIEILKHLEHSGWREVILLDLGRVGSGKGADCALAAEAQASLPGLHLLIGGGIAKTGELTVLKSTGIAGVLVATALHKGIIDPQCISSLGAK
jgi:phosphoribosylformimino-5-aminoimidazole carboxamide ribotide isomerase